jgi:DinB superfamily
MMMKRTVVVLALAACCVTGAKAQMGPTAPKVPAGTIIEPGKSMEALLNIYEEEIVGAAKAMPAEKYNFAPSQAIFAPSQKVDFVSPKSVNTFGQTVAHIAQANYSFFSSLGGAKPDVDMKAMGGLTSKEDTVKALEGSFAYAHKQLATLTAADAFASVRGDMTKTSVAAFGIAHMCDHYGQLVEYLRMNGIVPPASAK